MCATITWLTKQIANKSSGGGGFKVPDFFRVAIAIFIPGGLVGETHVIIAISDAFLKMRQGVERSKRETQAGEELQKFENRGNG